MKVKYFAKYRDITNIKEESIPATPDIWTLLITLCERYGNAFKVELITDDGKEICGDIVILVNGRNICHLDGKNTPLTESDVVSIFPVVAGG